MQYVAFRYETLNNLHWVTCGGGKSSVGSGTTFEVIGTTDGRESAIPRAGRFWRLQRQRYRRSREKHMLAAQISQSSRGDRVAGAREPPPSVSNITKYVSSVWVTILLSHFYSSRALRARWKSWNLCKIEKTFLLNFDRSQDLKLRPGQLFVVAWSLEKLKLGPSCCVYGGAPRRRAVAVIVR